MHCFCYILSLFHAHIFVASVNSANIYSHLETETVDVMFESFNESLDCIRIFGAFQICLVEGS